MKFRLKAFGVHLGASAVVLSLIFTALYFGWYRWPGWYLAEVGKVVLVMAGVDLIVGPLLTLVIANDAKPRRELRRDVAVIVALQMCALAYGVSSLWSGRPLYYAYSENVIQLVQAYDIGQEEWDRAAETNPVLAPHWYSLPRWAWAPLPDDTEARTQIVNSATSGGDDVISMPRYFKPWNSGLPTLKAQLKRVDNVPYFSPQEKARLKAELSERGLPADAANTIPYIGRGAPLLAVFDVQTVRLVELLRPRAGDKP